MSRQLQLTQWQDQLATRFPEFSTPVVATLALYSFGVLLAQVSGLTSVVLFLVEHHGYAYDALRKRLREFYLDAPDKSGAAGLKRRDLDVTTAFAPLLRWILALWAGRHLPLAIDVTNLGDRFHVLCVSVVVRGIALPVAWKVLLGGQKEPWNPHWVRLLKQLRTAVPDDWTVIVLSDRGLESPDLFLAIVGLGWHPLMRIKKGGMFRPSGWQRFHGLMALAGCEGRCLALEGWAYSGRQLRSTLLSRWEGGYAEPWLLLTDLPPESAQALWYGLRTWIEQGFKVIKSGAWDWDKTRMEDPSRVERLWLVLAVATLWVAALGIAAEVAAERAAEQHRLEEALNTTLDQARQRQQKRLEVQAATAAKRRARLEQRRAAKAAKAASRKKSKAVRHRQSGATAKQRVHRVTRRGLAVLRGAWQRGENPLPEALHPEPWPKDDHPVDTLNELDFL